MALTDNLISYWKLDEASGNALDAHGSNELTDTNTVGSASGKINNARDFDTGTEEYFYRTSNASLSVADEDFTWAAWVRLETKTARRPILGKISSGGTNEYYLEYNQSSDRFVFRVTNGVEGHQAEANNLGSPSTATWYYVVGWYDSTANTINIQVNNGTADSTAHDNGSHNNGAGFAIGRFGDLTTEPYFDGLIDEVGFWKRVLTAQERTDLYNGGSGLSYNSFGGGGGTALMGQICY